MRKVQALLAGNQGVTMNAENETLGAYLRQLFRAVNRRAAVEGDAAYTVQIHDQGLDPEEIDLLR